MNENTILPQLEQAAEQFINDYPIKDEEILNFDDMHTAFYAGYNHCLKSGALNDRWISVRDDEDMTMPPFEEKTLIICADGEQYIGYFNGADNRGYVWFCDNNDYHYPTHWQPLPQPPVTR